MLAGNHQNHRAAGGWSARILGATSMIALAMAIGAITPQPAAAFMCDSTANPIGSGGGTTDGGTVSNTACGNDVLATGTNNSSAFGSEAEASGSHATAIGAQSDATSLDSTAVGFFANANAQGATAVGGGGGTGVGTAAANANGEFSVAIGGGDADDEGAHTSAAAVNAIAIGRNSDALHANSTAIGTGAVTTADNQMMFGTASETYTTPGITSVTSRSRQSGPLEVVTSDANGNLATDGGAIFSQLDQLQSNDTKIFSQLDKLHSDINTVESGVAVALSAVGPDLVGAERFGLSLNWGGFEGASAIGGGATAVVSRWNGSRLAVTGGIGVGLDDNSVGGRAGGQWTW